MFHVMMLLARRSGLARAVPGIARACLFDTRIHALRFPRKRKSKQRSTPAGLLRSDHAPEFRLAMNLYMNYL